MDYKYKKYNILTNKNIEETKIVTLSDLNWNDHLSTYDINDLLLIINDILPKYVFILGNVCTFNNLENQEFNEKLTYFFKLLSCISKSFIVFGNHDYMIDKNKKGFYTHIDNLFNYYKNAIPYYLNNYYTSDGNINIVGFNKNYLNYDSIDETKKELYNLINKISNTLTKDKFNILITHYELEHLKLEKELFEIFDLVLTGTSHKMVKRKIFNFNNENDSEDENEFLFEDKNIIKTGGVCKGEIGFVKIKNIKKGL